MKKLISLLLALVMCLSLVACGGGVDKQPAIDAFNSAVTKFDELSTEMNKNIQLYPEDLVDTMIEMSEGLAEHKAILEGEQELSQEDVDMLVGVFNDVENWVDETMPELETYLEALGVQSALDAFDLAAAAYNDFAGRVNAEIEIYPDSFIAEMNELADLMNQMQDAVAQAESLTPEEIEAIAKTAEDVMAWVEMNDVQLVESDELLLNDVKDYFNTLVDRFDTIAYMVQENPSAFADEFVADMVTISDSMSSYSTMLTENGEAMTQAELAEFVEALADVDMWMQAVESELGIGIG